MLTNHPKISALLMTCNIIPYYRLFQVDKHLLTIDNHQKLGYIHEEVN